MKILFVIDTLQGSGAERSLVEIAQHFKRYTPVFVHVYEGNMLVPVLQKAGIETYSLNIPMERNFPLAAKKLEEVYVKEQPDLIHSTLFKSDVITRKLKSKYKIPLVSSYVNNNYNPLRFEELGFIQGLKMRLVQLYDAWSSRRVDYFISNSETIKKAKANSTFVEKSKVKVIFRGRDVQNFKDDLSSEKILALKRSLNIQNQKVLLNVSRLIERKGQMDLINALPAVLKYHPETVLLVAGHGTYKVQLSKRIMELGLEDNVQLVGRRQDIPDLLKMADFFIYPSYFEGLPGALIEAMLAGKIIICSDIPENLECVDKDSAIIFKRGDVQDLTKKIIYALSNRELHYGVKARNTAVDKFDIKKIAFQYEKTYDEILKLNL